MSGPAYDSTHHLLLALAGHLDDDLLGWARELVAVGEEARAVALVTAEVVASRTALPEAARAALAAAGQVARVEIAAALPGCPTSRTSSSGSRRAGCRAAPCT